MEEIELRQRVENWCTEENLTLVSLKWTKGEEGERILEILIDKDYDINLEEISAFSEKISPLLDSFDLGEDYFLDVASGSSAREIPFSLLPRFKGQWLDVKMENGVKTMMLDETDEGEATFHYFQKGKKTKKTLTKEQIHSIRMGYKA